MKVIWSTVGMLVCLMLLHPGAMSGQQAIDRGAAVDNDARLKIWVPAGSVRLTGWDRDSLHVRGVVDGGTVFLGGSRNAWKIMVEGDNADLVQADIDIRLPRGAQVAVKTVTATIVTTDVTGWFNSVSGDVIVKGTARRLEAETLGGDIAIEGQAPWLSARTGSGTIKIEGRFRDVRASSVSGAISVLNKLVDRGRFESITGDIRYRGHFAPGGEVEFDSHGGTITLVLPTEVAGRFALTTITGTIDNQYSDDLPVDRAEGVGQDLELHRGSGGSRVTVRSFKGTIRLRSME